MSLPALLDCLQREHAAVERFVALLQIEGEALARRAPAATMGDCTARKERTADEIATLGRERDALLQALGFRVGHAGADAAALVDPAVADAWEALHGAAVKARALNERNGLLVRAHLRHAQKALAAMRAATGAELYGANGRQGSPLAPPVAR